MGFLGTIKGWFNIGGVKVKLKDVPSQISKAGGTLNGHVTLTSKGEKHVLKVQYKLIEEKTTGRGDDEETEELVLGQSICNDSFDIKTGEDKTLDFAFDFELKERLADSGGMLGAVGKLGAFASGQKLKYFLVAECDVKGTAFDPSDRVELSVVE